MVIEGTINVYNNKRNTEPVLLKLPFLYLCHNVTHPATLFHPMKDENGLQRPKHY